MKTLIFRGDHNLTSPYGWRVFQGIRGWHNGTDFAMPVNTENLALKSGSVMKNGVDRFGGLYTWVRHNDGSGAIYRHLSRYALSEGASFKAGDVVAYSGNTGKSTGPHLHYTYLQNANDESTNRNPLDYILYTNNSNTPMNNSEFITVQAGWGLSLVARAAGLPENEATYQAIYNLNQGHRGSTDWRSLNKRVGAGDVLRVRAAAVSIPAVDNSAEVKKLKDQLEAMQKAKVEAENKAKVEYEQLVLKSVELEAAKQAEIEKLSAEKMQQKIELETQLEQLNTELRTLASTSIQLPPKSEAYDIAIGLIVNGIKASGIKGKWHAFIDRTFKSDYVRSFLKYDWFYVIVIAIGAYTFIASQYTGDNEVLVGIIATMSGIASQIMKYIVTNYDRNKDGKIDYQDLTTID